MGRASGKALSLSLCVKGNRFRPVIEAGINMKGSISKERHGRHGPIIMKTLWWK
jgi:hypothetical protein